MSRWRGVRAGRLAGLAVSSGICDRRGRDLAWPNCASWTEKVALICGRDNFPVDAKVHIVELYVEDSSGQPVLFWEGPN